MSVRINLPCDSRASVTEDDGLTEREFNALASGATKPVAPAYEKSGVAVKFLTTSPRVLPSRFAFRRIRKYEMPALQIASPAMKSPTFASLPMPVYGTWLK